MQTNRKANPDAASMPMPAKNEAVIISKLIWVVLFSIAFAWVEASVVVYLREIYFGGDFRFPIPVSWVQGRVVLDELAQIEFLREMATIIMLFSIGCCAGSNRLDKFAFFILSFGLWDILYYFWLHTMVGWPQSLLTWDLLFLIPLPWVGPVLAPLLIATVMVIVGILLIFAHNSGLVLGLRWYDWFLEIASGVLMIVAFCWDWRNILQYPSGAYDGIPKDFAWWLFLPTLCISVSLVSVRVIQMIFCKREFVKE